jgi:hypothetical protein
MLKLGFPTVQKKKESGKISVVKISKKGDFENPKIPNHDFSIKSVSN